ncbi:TPA: hypothetical protein ACH3X1_007637 [Trebouxia sp. C0004]
MSVLHETWAYTGQFDIIMLSEIQTSATLHQQLPNHVVHTIPASTVGRRGEGLLLAVNQQLPFSITHWDADQANCVIWLTLRPSHTNQRATTIGVCYVPPETTLASQPDGRSAQLRFHAPTERLLVATAQGHAVLAGDFNARVGSLPDPWVADVGDSIPPQLQNSDNTVNAHGQFDIIMLSETQTIATLHQQLPNHVVHTIPASTVGRRGEGLLLAVNQQLPFSITHWDADQANCVIWLTLRPSHTNQRATTIGVCYVPVTLLPDDQTVEKEWILDVW